MKVPFGAGLATALLRLPANRVGDRVVAAIIRRCPGIESLLGRAGWQVRLHPCAAAHVLALRIMNVCGQYEAGYLDLLKRILRPGDVVADVGANEGYMAIPLAQRVGPTGRVYCVEPHPANIASLQANIALNGLANITIVPQAAGDEPAHLEFHGDGAWGSLLDIGHLGYTRVRVPVNPLETLVPRDAWPKLRLIKLDVEGNEIRALRGARALLQASRPLVAFELNLSLLAYVGISINEVFHWFRDHQYQVYKEQAGRLQPYEWLDERIMNLVAVPGEWLQDEGTRHALGLTESRSAVDGSRPPCRETA